MTFFTDESLLRHLETAITLPLCLLVVLAVHEIGHYIAARLMDVQVESVTFGRGRILWSRTDSRGTLWRLHLWPLRAHVHIAGFNHPDMPFGKKMTLILAGPIANFLLPFLLFFIFFASFGQPVIPNIVTGVDTGLPAYKAGVRPGDKIISIDGQAVRSMDDIKDHTRPKPVKPLDILYERGGQQYTAQLMPVWAKYRDIDGVKREHGRIGLTTWQQAYNLDVVRSVAGVKTPDEDAARAALLKHMGTRTEIGLWSKDGNVYVSVIDLSEDSNRNLADPEHKEYNRFYLGHLRDNVYLRLSPNESARQALTKAGTMISNVARLPFNLFPVNKDWITPDAVVTGETSKIAVKIYVFVFFTALCSCVIGFLNLLPFPRLDGGEALLLIGEKIKRRPLERREQATLFVVTLLLLYAAIFGSNMDDLRSYYLFQIRTADAAPR